MWRSKVHAWCFKHILVVLQHIVISLIHVSAS
jgi:hypothetical protein